MKHEQLPTNTTNNPSGTELSPAVAALASAPEFAPLLNVVPRPNPREFISDQPGYVASDVEADLAVLEAARSRRAVSSESTNNAELLEQTIIPNTLRSLLPPEYAVNVYYTSEIDDALNGIDLVCELEKADEPPLRFLVDTTYNGSEITKKLTRRSSAGKRVDVPPKHLPADSEFDLLMRKDTEKDEEEDSPEYEPNSQNKTKDKTGLIYLEPAITNRGLAHLKYFEDSEGNRGRLAAPKVILGLPAKHYDQPVADQPEFAAEGLLFELKNQFEHVWLNLYSEYTKHGIIHPGLVTPVEDSRKLMHLFEEIDAAHAADPALADVRAEARNNYLCRRIVRESEKEIARPERFLPTSAAVSLPDAS